MATIVSYLAALLFVYAAVSKVLDYPTFTVQLAQSPLLSAFAGTLAWAVPTVEILLAVALLIPKYRLWGLFGFFTVMAMFTGYIVFILKVADFVPCSCGGVLEKLGWGEHLAFNIGWLLAAAAAISIQRRQHLGRQMVFLTMLLWLAGTTITLLYAASEKQMHRNNAFQRRHVPHPIEEIGSLPVPYPSLYIAGMDSNTVYMGDYKAPLKLYRYSVATKIRDSLTISLSNTQFPFRSTRIAVQSPYFFLGDGSVPVLFRGTVATGKAAVWSKGKAYFQNFVGVDSNRVALTISTAQSKKTALATLIKGEKLIINDTLLQGVDLFQSDGFLVWNAQLQKLLYTYRYRNQWVAVNAGLSHNSRGTTIDTVSHPVVDVGYYKASHQYKIGPNTIEVNKNATTYNQWLLVQSDRLGRYEEQEIFEVATAIDVYNLNSNSYAFSFYAYHQPGEQIREIYAAHGRFATLTNNTLTIYRLRPGFFNPSDNPTHTAQYQE